jgi:methionine-rich copper-binding protein CopC
MTRRAQSVAVVACLAILAALTASVSAHLAVSKTMPADQSTVLKPPARVQVWFTQQPSPRVSLLQMKGPGGAEVELGDMEITPQDRSIAVAVRGTLAPGRYEVTWRTAGDDGHVIRGTFAFSLKAAE